MSTADSRNESLSTWWVILFLLLTLGLAAVGVLAVGGQLVVAPA